MPLGGETIGRAYVRILADGSGLSDDVKRQMREHSTGFDAAGRNSSKDFWDGYDDETDKRADTSMRDLKKRMDRSAGRFQASGDLLGDKFMIGLRGHLQKQFKDVGTVMYANLNDALESGQIDFDGLMHQLEDLRPLVAKATQDIAADQKKEFDDLDRSVRRYSEGLDKSGRSRQDFLRDLRRMAKTMPSTSRGYAEFTERVSDMRRTLGDASPKLARFRASMDKAGDSVGRAFGKGSRNNAVNIIGVLMGRVAGLSRALSSFTKWPGLVGEQIGRMAAKFQGAIDEAGSLRKALLNMAEQGLPGLIAAAVTAAAVFYSVGISLGVLASALVLTSGIVVALAGSLSFALVGGLAAVALALVPVLFGMGALVVAITDIDTKSKVFKNLRKEWGKLRTDMTKAVLGKDMGGLKGLTELVKVMRPLLMASATAVGDLLDSFAKNVKTKEFRDMIADITAILPGMIHQLGRIAGNLLLSVGEAFVAAEPLVTRFLGWLDKVTKAMADSGKGGKKSPMAKFFADVEESARIVGTLILEVIGLVGDLFGAGKDTGDNIFLKIAGWIKTIRDWLADPANKETIDQFFTDAEKLADKLGEVVTSVGDLIDALDTPTSRFLLFKLLDITTTLLGLLEDLAIQADETGTAIGTGINNGLEAAKGHINEMKNNGEPWATLKTRAGEAWTGIQSAFAGSGTWWQNLWTTTKTSAAEGFASFKLRAGEAWTGIKKAFEPMTSFFSTLWLDIKTQASTAWDGFTERPREAVAKIQEVWDRLYTYLVGGSLIPELVTEIIRIFATLGPGINLGDIKGKFTTWVSGLPAKARGAVKGIIASWPGLSGKMIRAAGPIGEKFGNWVRSLPGKARASANGSAGGFNGLAGKMIGRAGSISAKFGTWLGSLPGKARANSNSTAGGWSGLAGKMIARAGSLSAKFSSWTSGVRASAARAASSAASAFSGLAGRIIRAIGPVNILARVKLGPLPSVPTIIAKVIAGKIKSAEGGIFGGAQLRMIGEAGPEAIVPLNRALSRVDPAVRELSAIAQGLKVPNMAAGGGNVGKQIDVGGITIITPTRDPRAVASEVVARMAAASYL